MSNGSVEECVDVKFLNVNVVYKSIYFNINLFILIHIYVSILLLMNFRD